MPNDAASGRAHSEPGSTASTRRPLLIAGLVVGVVLLDQVTKAWVVASLSDGPLSIIGDRVELRLSRNPGGAFSILTGFTPLLAVLAAIVAIVLVRVAQRAKDPVMVVALSLVLGGALGNLIDRLFRAPGSCAARSSTSSAWARSRASTWPTPRSRSGRCSSCSGDGATATSAANLDERDGVSELTVPATLAGERLDRALALLTGWSRAEVARLIDDGAVLVGGQPVAKSHRLETGALVELLSEPAPDRPPGPEPVPIDVRFADDDLIVVSKPAGLVVHPGAGHPGGTLVNGLLQRFPELSEVGDPARPGIVHRLDRDTSGLMLVARSARAYDVLVAALARRDIERRYLALVWGRFDSPAG